MLVLTRNEGQRIMIDGGKIVIQVMEVTPGRVRIGIECPRDILVDREEVYLARKGKNASGNQSTDIIGSPD